MLTKPPTKYLWCPTCSNKALRHEEFLTFLCDHCGKRAKLTPIPKETNIHG